MINRTCTFHVNRIHVVQQRCSIEHLSSSSTSEKGAGSQPDRRCETNGNYSQARFAPEIRRRSRRGSDGIFGVARVLRLSSRVSYPWGGGRARGREAGDEGRREGASFLSPPSSPSRVSPAAGRKLYRGPMMHRPEMARVVPGRKCGHIRARAYVHTRVNRRV